MAVVLILENYDFEVVYRKGAYNTVADALSRKPELEQGELLALSTVSSDLFAKIAQSWLEDEELKKIIQELSMDKSSHSKFVWQNNQFRKKGKLVVGNDVKLRQELLEYYHNSAVGGH